MDELNYFKFLFIVGNLLVLDDFSKKRQNLTALFVCPVWISKEQEAIPTVFTNSHLNFLCYPDANWAQV